MLGTLKQYGLKGHETILDTKQSKLIYMLADCHGVPYCSDIYYGVRDCGEKLPTNIGMDLYRKIEEMHEEWFNKIRNYLGPTYYRLPSALALVLSKCKRYQDIPDALVSTREQFSSLRERCTLLEIDLRTAKTIEKQIKIILEIESCREAVAKQALVNKPRISNRLFDILKHIDPIKMATEAIDQAKEYDLEREALIKIPSYFDLWSTSLDVEQALPQIQRLFGDTNASDILHRFTKLRH